MAFSYSISYGIAGGFITYCIVKTCKKQAKEVHPVIWVVSLLFILDFIITAVLYSPFHTEMGGSFSGIAHFLYRLSYRFDADPH
mgnify:CR=1 FL=1